MGSHTSFAVGYENGRWYNWVLWGGTWEAIFSYSDSNLLPANALADYLPAEVILVSTQYVEPMLSSPIADNEGQLENSSGTWAYWGSGIPATAFEEGGYVTTTPTRYSNVTVSN